ncbi:MAG: hypothetical protein V1659_02570 [Candidatus Woesearchaeota archaeon]
MGLNEPHNWVSLFVGLIVTAFGLIPLLSKLKLIPSLLGFLDNIVGVIGVYLIVAFGLYILLDSFLEDNDNAIKYISIVVAIAVVAVGLITMLNSLKIIAFKIPIVTPIVFNIIFVVEGLFLIIAAFAMER